MRDEKKLETRRLLYQAALEVFCRDGVGPSNVKDITDRVGVSRASFYFHFESKDDVLLELLEEVQRPLAHELDMLPAEATLTQVLETAAHLLADFWSQGERGKLLVEMFAVSVRRQTVMQSPESDIVRAAASKRFRLAVERQQLTDVMPAEVLVDSFFLNCTAAMAAWSVTRQGSLRALLEHTAHLFLKGVEPK